MTKVGTEEDPTEVESDVDGANYWRSGCVLLLEVDAMIFD